MASRTPKHTSTGLLHETFSSQERKHYNRALKEMFEIVKLGTLKSEITNTDVTEMEEDDGHVVDRHPKAKPRPTRPTGTCSGGTSSAITDDEYSESCTEAELRKLTRSGKKKSGEEKLLKENRIKSMDIDNVSAELHDISKGLQKENKRLKIWEKELKDQALEQNKRDEYLGELEDSYEAVIQEECQKRCSVLEQTFEERIAQAIEESKKSKLSFKIVKQANASLKKQLNEIQDQNKKLEERMSSLNNRLSNLQRKNEILGKQAKENVSHPLDTKSIPKKVSSKGGSPTYKAEESNMLNIMAILLGWVSETQLKQTTESYTITKLEKQSSKEHDVNLEIICERCLKVVSSMSDCLQRISSAETQLPFLQFIYWSLIHIENAPGRQRNTPLATYRRIGEELYKSQTINTDISSSEIRTISRKEEELSESLRYFRSTNQHIRILSSLLILRTLNQADILAQVLEILKSDLRGDAGKDFFLNYHGEACLLPFLKPSNKGLLSVSIDCLMQLSIESPYLSPFLDGISNQMWFKVLLGLIQTKGIDVKIIEKLSIILQRLSKIRSNKKYFDALKIGSVIQEFALTCDPDDAFLALNLRSILFNLNAMKPNPNA